MVISGAVSCVGSSFTPLRFFVPAGLAAVLAFPTGLPLYHPVEARAPTKPASSALGLGRETRDDVPTADALMARVEGHRDRLRRPDADFREGKHEPAFCGAAELWRPGAALHGAFGSR